MIKSITLNNFRSYKNQHIEFDPKVTVITGENDSGKTNILRAINWIANNRPTGEEMRSIHGGDTVVRLGVINNNEVQVVERFRSNSENLYKIDGKSDSFKSFGQGVPDFIQKVLNFNFQNIQFQLEGPFLLGKSPADVARYYNDAVNLEIIDRAIKNIAKTLRDENTELTRLKNDQKVQTDKLKSFDWLPEAEAKLLFLEKKKAMMLRLESEYVLLSELSESLKNLSEKYHQLNKITRYENAVNILLKLDEKIEIKTTEYNELESLITTLNSLKSKDDKFHEILRHEIKVKDLILLGEQISIKRSEFSELSSLETQLKDLNSKSTEHNQILKSESKVDKLIALDKQIDAKTTEYNELFDLTKQIEDLNERFENLKKEEKELQIEFDKLMPDICPLCGK